MGIKSGKLRKSVLMLGLVVVAGCTQIDRFHGFIPPAEEIATLQVGASTKEEVITLFGPPISDRALENNTIYYASSQFRYFGPLAPRLIDREILAVDFDGNDVMRNVTSYTMDDGRVVVLNRRVTEDGINDVTFLSQLFASFGRLDAGTFLGEQ
jgi:outer membrane protein assembly factor BamE (lipoprotein component of BamABCDE complex)